MPAEDIRFGALVCTSKFQYNENPDRWEHIANEELCDEVAHGIIHYRAKTEFYDDRVEKRIDLYIATPDMFWKIVKEEAEKIAFRFRPISKE